MKKILVDKKNDKVSTNEVEELKGEKNSKGLLGIISNKAKNISNKARLLAGEIKYTSEGTKEADYSNSFGDVFKFNLKLNSLPLLNNNMVLSKLDDYSL